MAAFAVADLSPETRKALLVAAHRLLAIYGSDRITSEAVKKADPSALRAAKLEYQGLMDTACREGQYARASRAACRARGGTVRFVAVGQRPRRVCSGSGRPAARRTKSTSRAGPDPDEPEPPAGGLNLRRAVVA